MTARRLAIRATPMASVMVTAAGRPSGMAPTASAIAAVNVSTASCRRSSPTPKVTAARPRMAMVRILLNRTSFCGQRRRENLRGTHEAMDFTEFGLGAGRDDDAGAAARGHQGAGIRHVAAISHRSGLGQHDFVFVDRRRLPGQRGLVHPQLGLAHQPQVGGNLVAGLQQHQIAGNQLLGRHGVLVAVAHHLGLGAHHGPQALQRGLGLGLLNETHDRVDDHHTEDHCGVDEFPQTGGDRPRDEQNIDQRMMKLAQYAHQQAGARSHRQRIGTEALQSIGRLDVWQTPGADRSPV